MVDLTRAEQVTEEVEDEVYELFRNRAWDRKQIERGDTVRNNLDLTDVRMLTNLAITHEGRY